MTGAVSRASIKLKGPWEKTAAWARVLTDGRIELELYDFSAEAQSAFGNDIAWMYHIEPNERPRLIAVLGQKIGASIPDDMALLTALAGNFRDVHAIRDWLKQERIPFTETFDSWA